MAPCDPTDLNLTEPVTPGIPGLGPVAPIQIPFPDVALPEGFPENLLDLIEQFLALFPSNVFRPNLDNFSKDVLDAIVSLLNQISPYLGLYKFFIALLNMIICIIGVFCALTNPFSFIRALRNLFRRCLPDFLNLFPWLALIAMIISLLLLLLAIIEYIIAQILRMIAEILRNIQILTDAVSRNDAEKTLAAIRKLASLICLIENLFAVLQAFGAIFDIIRALANVGINSVCESDDNLQGIDVGCCPQEVCPNFVSQNEGSFPPGTLGRLVYHKELEQDVSGLGFPLVVPPIREERYQFVDVETGKEFNMRDIIDEVPNVVFFPAEREFVATSPLSQVPYSLSIRFFADATTLSLFNISGLPRFLRINDMRIKREPYVGVLEYDDTLSSTPDTGTVLPTGGLAFEDDGTTPVLDSNGAHASLETLITQAPDVGLPPNDDGYTIDNVEFTTVINEEALLSYDLITGGCVLRTDRAVLNQALIGDVVPPIDLIDLPDISGSVDCLLAATRKFRDNLSTAGAADLQADTEACLNDLKDQTLTAHAQAVCAGFNQYGSTVEVDPDVQFINNVIVAKVSINDQAGTSLITNMPVESQEKIADKLDATVTLGSISDFTYDGYEDVFVANITSNKGGDGELKVTFDGETFNNLLGTDNLDDDVVIEENVTTYTFVTSGFGVDAGDAGAGRLPGVRRDEGDVSRDGSD